MLIYLNACIYVHSFVTNIFSSFINIKREIFALSVGRQIWKMLRNTFYYNGYGNTSPYRLVEF